MPNKPATTPLRPGIRLNPQQSERSRSAIATTQIIKRLNSFVLGEKDVKMTPHQITAAIALLKKTLPDLQSIESTATVTISTHEEVLSQVEAAVQQVRHERAH